MRVPERAEIKASIDGEEIMSIYAGEDYLEGESVMKNYFLESSAPFFISLSLIVFDDVNNT